MNLTSTNQIIELVTSGALATTYVVSWTDIDKTAATAATPGSGVGSISTATTTTIVAAPSASVYRVISVVSIRNESGSTQTVTVQKDVGGTNYTVTRASLATLESLHYEDAHGWYVLDATGSRKGVGATGAAGTNGGGTILGTGTSIVDFGAGAADATVTVTGQTAIVGGSLVYVWVKPEATVDHSVDEHLVEAIKVYAKDVVAGTGFTIHAFSDNRLAEPPRAQPSLLTRYSGTGVAPGPGIRHRSQSINETAGSLPFVKGKWSIGWMYTQ